MSRCFQTRGRRLGWAKTCSTHSVKDDLIWTVLIRAMVQESKSQLFLLFHRFTARITELMKVLKELNAGKYERTMVSQQDKGTVE